MAQISETMQVPSAIRWDEDGDIGQGGIYTDTADISSTKNTLFLTWSSDLKTFQVQMRSRKRKSPANAASVSSSGADVWTEWTVFKGSDLSADTAADTTHAYGSTHYLTSPLTFAYDFADYDFHEYEVRVRSIDATSLLCSEWAYQLLKVRYRPTWDFSECASNGGETEVLVTCNSARPSTLTLRSVTDAETGAKLYSGNGRFALPAGGGIVKLPFSAGPRTELTFNGTLTTSDGSIFSQKTTLSVGKDVQDETIKAPEVTFEDYADSTRVCVDGLDSDASVYIDAEWTGTDGELHCEEFYIPGPMTYLPEEEGSKPWGAVYFKAAPVGVEVRYLVTVYVNGLWNSFDFSHTAPIDGRMAFVDGKDVIVLRYDTSYSYGYTPEGDEVKCAGRSKEVARFGTGGTHKMSATGTVLSPRIDPNGCWIPDVEKLRGNRTWLYRDPLGERARVRVRSLSKSSSHPDSVTYSISLVEVE